MVVTKQRVSGFAGSDQEVILRSQGIVSTFREAADKDYRISVLSDCCADPDPEVHQLLLTKIFPRQAEVLESAQWINQIGQ
jgi:nicotinamidase-related amidase